MRFLLRLIAMGSLLQCAGAAQDAAVYVNRELDFSIVQPAGWERAENISGAALALTAPPVKDEFRWNVSVIVHDLPATTTLEQFSEAQSGGVEKILTAYGQDEKRAVELGKLKAERVVFHFTQKETAMKCLSMLTVGHERGYVLTCSADTAHFEEALKVFETIVASFKAL